ncbi:MAG: cytidine deaminase [Nocardioidaceae bacterium]
MAVRLTDPDDAKLVTLARANRARVGRGDGGAVRDADGRTYSAASIDLPSLQLSALELAVAMAASSGVHGLEACVVVTEQMAVAERDLAVVRDLAGSGVPVYRADLDGAVIDETKT